MKYFLTSLLLAASASAFSQMSISDVVKTLDRAPGGPQVSCFDPAVTPHCGEITEAYCQILDAQNGRHRDKFGEVNLGPSTKSKMSQIEKQDLLNLIQSQKDLPADLKKAMLSGINKIKSLLEKEEDKESWYRDLAKARTDLHGSVKKFSREQAQKEMSRRSPEVDIAARAEEKLVDNMDIITAAKLKNSPNWPNVEKIYDKVKVDMRKVINGLSLSQDEKNQRLKAVEETKLDFPFAVKLGGPLGNVINDDCRSNMTNAMYVNETKSLTLCAGFVNGLGTESSMYFALAHELAHSFNQFALQNRTISRTDPSAATTEWLINGNGKLACDQSPPQSAHTPAPDICAPESYSTFMSCLVKENPVDQLKGISKRGEQTVAFYEKIPFCDITKPETGAAFMNPDEFAKRHFSKVASDSSDFMSYVGKPVGNYKEAFRQAYVIVQEMKCNPEAKCEDILNMLKSNDIGGSASVPPLCRENAMAGIENEADWYAQRAMIEHSKSFDSIRDRREMVAGSMGFFCGFKYNHFSEAQIVSLMSLQDLIEDIKKNDTHSGNDSRSSGIMTADMAAVLQCERPASQASNYQDCRL